MVNFFEDNEDLQYYFERGIDWESLVSLTERDFTDEPGFADAVEAIRSYRRVAERVGEFAAREVAPHAVQLE
ncbi:MAG: hypothetical protein H5U40_13860, partial [Polyangiaceae bacterium]|nr:hypothetical protein [Polyangiaceae bacterium]